MATARTPLMAGNWKMNLNHLEAMRPGPEARLDARRTRSTTSRRSRSSCCRRSPTCARVQTLVDGDKLADRVRRPGPLRARRRRLHRRDLGGDAGQARLHLRRGRPLRAPRVPRRDRRARQRQGAKALAAGMTPDRVRRRGPRGPPGRRARRAHAGPARRRAGRLHRRAGRRPGRSPTSRSGRSAPARSPRPRTRRRSARAIRGAARRGATATRPPTRVRILYGGSVKAANVAGIMEKADVDGCPGRRREPGGRRVRRDLPLLRHAGPVIRRHRRDVGFATVDSALHHPARDHQRS